MSTIPMALFLLNFMGLSDVLTISSVPRFLCSLHCRVIVLSPCTILTIVVPDNSCRKGAITSTYLLHPGFNIKVSCGNKGIALFINLNSECLALCSPSTSCMFFMPNTISMLSCISDTKVNSSNLCSFIVNITGMTNNVATLFPFPTCRFFMCVWYLGSCNDRIEQGGIQFL